MNTNTQAQTMVAGARPTDGPEHESKGAPRIRVSRVEEALSVRGLGAGSSPGWRAWLVPPVLLGLAAFLFLLNGRHDAAAEDGEEARSVVVAHVEQLLSYDHRTIEDDLAREKDWLTGSFVEDYAALVSDEIAPAAAKAKVVTDARVSASGVVSADEDDVELLLFVTVTTRSDELDEPRVSGSRLVVTVDLVDGEWRISALDPV